MSPPTIRRRAERARAGSVVRTISGSAPFRPRLGQRVGLATVTRAAGADGVAHVARLLDRALSDLTGLPPWTADLDARKVGPVSLPRRVRFAARVAAGQLLSRFDWLLYNHIGIAGAQSVIPRRFRLPYGVFVHGVEVWEATLSPSRLATLRNASLIIANSAFTARRLAERHPELKPASPCALGLAPNETRPPGDVDRALLETVRPRSVLIAGRMSAAERYKGHDQLLEAWATIRALAPGAQLVVVGGGDDEARLAGRSRALGVSDDVLFCGRVSDATLDALFARVALFAMPSRGEGFGVVYLQAMRAGLACVGATDDAAGEVIDDGRTGLLVPQRDVADLASAIAQLLADRDRAAAMGRAGRERYERQFTYERFRDRLSDVLSANGAMPFRGA